MSRSWFITGGAGFLGGHLQDRLLARTHRVVVYDKILGQDCLDLEGMEQMMPGADVVVHLASNPDISKASSDPDLDFRQGTMLTRNVLEAARRAGVREFVYASGSGVYGDQDGAVCDESALALPISPYGASKLAGEGLVSAYTSMFGWKSTILRFGNIVGPRQTHGVGFDFIRKLRADPTRLRILGDGRQSKPYVHVRDAVAGMLLAHDSHDSGVEVFNVAPADQIDVMQVAQIVCGAMDMNYPRVYPMTIFGTSPTGWPGDVPVMRLDSGKLRALGWNPMGSFQAMTTAVGALVAEGAHVKR